MNPVDTSDDALALILQLFVVIVAPMALFAELNGSRIIKYVSDNDNAPHGQLRPRPLGIAIWISFGIIFLILSVVSILVNKVLIGISFFGLGAVVFIGFAVDLAKTTVSYDSTSIRVKRLFIKQELQLSMLKRVARVASPVGGWRLELRFVEGGVLYFDQYSFCGINAMFDALQELVNGSPNDANGK